MALALIIGAYATAPKSYCATVEDKYYSHLCEIPNLSGWEVPFLIGNVFDINEAVMLPRFKGRTVVLSTIPITMSYLEELNTFGLAADDHIGRCLAIDMAKEALAAVLRINAYTGEQTVIAVQFHSAPGISRGGY